MLSFPFSVTTCIILFFLVILSVIGRIWQPLKSRGSTFMIGIILLFIELMVDMIVPLFYTIEFGFLNDFYKHTLFILPIKLNIKLLILIVKNDFY